MIGCQFQAYVGLSPIPTILLSHYSQGAKCCVICNPGPTNFVDDNLNQHCHREVAPVKLFGLGSTNA